MKKYGILCIFATLFAYADPTQYRTSRSFFFSRPVYHNLSATHPLWNDAQTTKHIRACSAFQLVGIYQESLSTCGLPGYFLTNCAPKVVIKGDNAHNSFARNVRAEWLNLPANFDGMLELNPRQKQAAAIVYYNQDLNAWFSHSWFDRLWVEISAPVVFVEQSLNPQQKIFSAKSDNSEQPSTIIEAFNQPDWRFSRICPSTQKEVGLAELRGNLGYTILDCDDVHLSTYSAFIIPTAKRQDPTYVFNPFVGINGHVGAATGLNFKTPLHDYCSEFKVLLYFAIESIYFFQNKQCRTFDIKSPVDRPCFCALNPTTCTPAYDPHLDLPLPDIIDTDLSCLDKQWSRYMLFRKKGTTITVPGVNILTQRVRVYPYATVDLDVGLTASYNSYHVAIGYNLWARSHERLELIAPTCEVKNFNFEHYGIAGKSDTASASASTIAHQAPDDPVFITLEQRDISLPSGSYAGGSAHRVYGNLGYYAPEVNNLFASVGGFYEIPNDRNTVFRNWGIWAKLGGLY